MPAKEGRQQKEKGVSQEGLQALAAREGQQRQLAAIRLELERLRLLLERVSKRERLKRESKLSSGHFLDRFLVKQQTEGVRL